MNCSMLHSPMRKLFRYKILFSKLCFVTDIYTLQRVLQVMGCCAKHIKADQRDLLIGKYLDIVQPVKVIFWKFSLTLYLCYICCVIERIFNWPGFSKNLFSMQYIAAGKFICFASILNPLKINCLEKTCINV